MLNSFLADNSVKRIPLGGVEWVDVKPELTYAEFTQVMKAAQIKDADDNSDLVNNMLVVLPFLKIVLVDWSFTNDDGSKIPCTHETIDRLRAPIITRILESVRLKDYLDFDVDQKKSS